MTHAQIIIAIIIIAGILGGLTNFLLLHNPEAKKGECWINFFKSIFLSLCASITVPLFLQIISNNILDIEKERTFQDKNYFLLLSFCVLAAFYSKRFLNDLYAKVNKAEINAEKAKLIAENTEQKNQEIEDVEEFINETQINKAFTNEYSKEEIKAVVIAILTSKYSFRLVTGIARDTNISVEKVNGILELLKNSGFAESKKNAKGNYIWKIIYKS
jgi:hypothetical protein